MRQERTMSNQGAGCRKRGFVSLWVGTFPTIEAAEEYFGIPDEIGVYLPPESFTRDLGQDDLPAENLEVHFEQLAPRSLRALLRDATFAASFIDRAVEEAGRQGVETAQGVALLYDFDYQAQPGGRHSAGPLLFIGVFPFAGETCPETAEPSRDPRIEVREITDDIL
jgi:hypothetical protein